MIKDFSHINTVDDLVAFSEKKAQSHSHVYHYTKKDAVIGIINNDEFWVRNTLYQNDMIESIDRIKRCNLHLYTASFSHDYKENLAQWFMYGDECKGFRLDVIKRELLEFKEVCISTPDGKVEEKLSHDDFKINIYDIIYYENREGSIVLIYDDIENTNFTSQDIEAIKMKAPILKTDLWKHEKETRIVIQLTDDAVNRANIHNEDYFLKIKKFRKNWKIIYGPIVDKDIDVDMEIGCSVYSGMVGKIPKSEPFEIDISGC